MIRIPTWRCYAYRKEINATALRKSKTGRYQDKGWLPPNSENRVISTSQHRGIRHVEGTRQKFGGGHDRDPARRNRDRSEEMLEGVVQSLSGTNAVILDLARVSRIDAHGLGVLLELREQAQTKGIRFELMNVSKFLRGVLEMTRLDSVFQITSGVEFFPGVAAERRQSITSLRSCA